MAVIQQSARDIEKKKSKREMKSTPSERKKSSSSGGSNISNTSKLTKKFKTHPFPI